MTEDNSHIDIDQPLEEEVCPHLTLPLTQLKPVLSRKEMLQMASDVAASSALMWLAQAVDYADAEGEQDPLDADAEEAEPLELVEGEEAAVSMEEAASAGEQHQNGTAEPAAETAAPKEEAAELRYSVICLQEPDFSTSAVLSASAIRVRPSPVMYSAETAA